MRPKSNVANKTKSVPVIYKNRKGENRHGHAVFDSRQYASSSNQR